MGTVCNLRQARLQCRYIIASLLKTLLQCCACSLLLLILCTASTAWAVWCRIVQHVNSVLTQECFLTIPTAPGPAPALDCTGEELESFRARALALTSIAGLCGLPEVTLPVASMENGPVGLSIVGPRGSDEELLVLAERLADTLNLP